MQPEAHFPKQNLLYAYSIDSNFNFFEGAEAYLNGRLKLGYDGMLGSGIMRFGSGEVESYEYTYETEVLITPTS